MRGLLNTQILKFDCDNFFDFPELQACDEILNSSKVLYFTRSASVQYSDVDIINVPYLKGDFNG